MPAGTKIWTIGEAIKWTSSFFSAKGIGNARLEAELLLAHILGCERIDLYLEFSRPLATKERARYREFVRRRAAGEPLQHILGFQQFRYLKLKVGPTAFIPRPETELLVDIAGQVIRSWPRKHPTVADIGTGSGAIALSLAHEIQDIDILAVDVSPDTLAIARENAEANNLADRVRFLEGNWLEPIYRSGVGPVDILLSNPPYVPSGDLAFLPAEVQEEPLAALDGGIGGLRFYSELAGVEKPAISKEAGIIVEIGIDQSEAIQSIFEASGWTNIRVHPDLAGIPRIIEARKKET